MSAAEAAPAPYDGPVVDSHHHIWHFGPNYPWMSGPLKPMIFGDDYAGMRRDYLVDELLADFAGHQVTKSVHVQANYDFTNPEGETAWLQGVADAASYPHGIVAYADMTDPAVEATLDAHLAYANTRGIRHQVYWHDNPHWRFVETIDFCTSAAFANGIAQCAARGLSFDFQVFPDQFGYVGELAGAHSDLRCCIVHAGMLTATDAATVDHWRRALESLVPLENVFIKVSGLNTFARTLEPGVMRIAIDTSLELFGPDRCFYGSNFPVEKNWTTYDAYLGANKAILAGRSRDVQQKFFHDTAAAFYRV